VCVSLFTETIDPNTNDSKNLRIGMV
jgi:hypothetical protein